MTAFLRQGLPLVFRQSLLLAALAAALAPAGAQAERPLATVAGAGVGAFVPGHPLEGLTTDFAVSATVSRQPTRNRCADHFAELGEEWEDFEPVAGRFNAAKGIFYCHLEIEGEGSVSILGEVRQGRVNDDGSITLCGTGTFIDFFVDEIFTDEPWAVTLRDTDPDAFTYYDVVTGPGGDSEDVIEGDIRIRER